MNWHRKRKFAIIPALLHKTAHDSTAWDKKRLESLHAPLTITFLNAHGLNQAMRNKAFAQFLLYSNYLLRDGIGIHFALQTYKLGSTPNLNGTDLIPAIIQAQKHKTIGLFGTTDEALRECQKRLEAQKYNVSVTLHGFHEDEVYLQSCNEIRPDILILCMGMPRQELLAHYLRQHGYQGMIICGGGWADFLSETKPRAPLWMRKLSLEWIYRLLQEPKRLGRRYTVDVIYFFYAITMARLLAISPKP